jgi:hypothetical protein
MVDLQQNFLASLQGGLNIGQQVRGIQNRNQLNQLASQAYGATTPEQQQSLLTNMAAIDPASAQAQQKSFASDEDRRSQTMVNMAKLLTSAPEQARPQLWQRFIPTLSQFGMSDLPTEYNPQTAPIIDQAAQSLVQAYGGGTGASGVQSTYVDNNGQRLAIMRDGSQRLLGPNNASIRVMEQEGAVPYGVVTSGGRPGEVVGIGGQAAAGGQAQPQGAYIDPSLPPEVQQQIRQSLAAGQEPPSNMTFASGPVRTPTAAEKAAATEQARLGVQQQFLPQELGMRTDAAVRQAAGIEQAKSQQERASNERAKTAQLNNVDRGLTRIDAALSGLNGRFVDTGPIDGRIMSSTPQGQELEAAVGAIQNDMLALTRVPGIGSQSDLEAKIDNLKYPSIYNAPEVNVRNAAQLKAFMNDLRRQIQSAPAQPQSAAADSAAPRQIQSPDEYNALPSGALFIAPDGTQRRKR